MGQMVMQTIGSELPVELLVKAIISQLMDQPGRGRDPLSSVIITFTWFS
jgi:hypothetical protein